MRKILLILAAVAIVAPTMAEAAPKPRVQTYKAFVWLNQLTGKNGPAEADIVSFPKGCKRDACDYTISLIRYEQAACKEEYGDTSFPALCQYDWNCNVIVSWPERLNTMRTWSGRTQSMEEQAVNKWPAFGLEMPPDWEFPYVSGAGSSVSPVFVGRGYQSLAFDSFRIEITRNTCGLFFEASYIKNDKAYYGKGSWSTR